MFWGSLRNHHVDVTLDGGDNLISLICMSLIRFGCHSFGCLHCSTNGCIRGLPQRLPVAPLENDWFREEVPLWMVTFHEPFAVLVDQAPSAVLRIPNWTVTTGSIKAGITTIWFLVRCAAVYIPRMNTQAVRTLTYCTHSWIWLWPSSPCHHEWLTMPAQSSLAISLGPARHHNQICWWRNQQAMFGYTTMHGYAEYTCA